MNKAILILGLFALMGANDCDDSTDAVRKHADGSCKDFALERIGNENSCPDGYNLEAGPQGSHYLICRCEKK